MKIILENLIKEYELKIIIDYGQRKVKEHLEEFAKEILKSALKDNTQFK